MRYHAKTALGSMLERHSEQWRSECKNIPATWNGRTELSAVAEHAVVECYEINWTTAKVIDTATNTRTRKVKEALHIAQTAPSMNKDSGMSLSASWYASVIP